MQPGSETPQLDTKKLIETLSAIDIAPPADGPSALAGRVNGARQAILQRLDALARKAVSPKPGAKKGLLRRKGAVASAPVPGLLEALVASIRNLEDVRSKARLAALVSRMASEQDDGGNGHADGSRLAAKLMTRALNYADRIEDPAERAIELLHVVDILTEDDPGSAERTGDFDDTIRQAGELTSLIADESARLRAGVLLVAVADKLRCGDLVPGALREAIDQARQEARKQADSEKAEERAAVNEAGAAAAANATAANGVPEGFVDPAAGIVFPTRRRRR